jgi:hypothetical protein
MSKDKGKAKERRMALIRDLADTATGRIFRLFNHEGGIGMTKDLARLIREGFLKIVRRPTGSSFGPHIRKSYVVRGNSPLHTTRDRDWRRR